VADRDPLWRRELDGYIRRHEDDGFAHAPMRHDFRAEMVADFLSHSVRLDSLEQWRDRIIGAVAMLTFLVTAGVITAVIELLRK